MDQVETIDHQTKTTYRLQRLVDGEWVYSAAWTSHIHWNGDFDAGTTTDKQVAFRSLQWIRHINPGFRWRLVKETTQVQLDVFSEYHNFSAFPKYVPLSPARVLVNRKNTNDD